MKPSTEENVAPPIVGAEPDETFDAFRQKLGFVLAPLAGLTTWFLTNAYSQLRPEGKKLSGILTCIAVLWICESVPLPVTALLGAVLCVTLGVAEIKPVLAPFADPIVFLFVGSFMLAEAMMIHKLDRRFALGFLRLNFVSRSPFRIMAGLGFVTAALSMWVSNTATTAMMLPIGLGILHSLGEAQSTPDKKMDLRAWSFATGLMLMLAYSASIGGIVTPVGSPPNLITLGLLKKLADIEISFVRWTMLMLPMFLLMFAALCVLLYWLHPGSTSKGETLPMEKLQSRIRAQYSELGGWSQGQINTMIVFVFAAVFWIVPGLLPEFLGKEHQVSKMAKSFPEPIVALIAAVLLFVLPINFRAGQFTLTWRQAAKIDWGTILLFGGGITLGSLMDSTGVAKSLGESLTGAIGASSIWALTAAAVALGIILSETTSNTAAANMIIPVIIALAKEAHVNPLPPVLGACLGASFGFMLPVSTPPNAIVYGSGFVPITAMLRAGIIFDILGFLLIVSGLYVLCPLLGFC